MADTTHLRNKQILFKLMGDRDLYSGYVTNEEKLGLWIHAPDLIIQLANDAAWRPLLANVKDRKPVLFVPFSALAFLIVADDQASQ